MFLRAYLPSECAW